MSTPNPIMNSSDWWNQEFGPIALHLQDNPVLALNVAQISADHTSKMYLADQMNKDGGHEDYTDETNKFS